MAINQAEFERQSKSHINGNATSKKWVQPAVIVIWAFSVYVYVTNLDGLVQYCSNSIANALEILECCIKPAIYW